MNGCEYCVAMYRCPTHAFPTHELDMREVVITAAMALVPWVEEVLVAFDAGRVAPNRHQGMWRLAALIAALRAAGEQL